MSYRDLYAHFQAQQPYIHRNPIRDRIVEITRGARLTQLRKQSAPVRAFNSIDQGKAGP